MTKLTDSTIGRVIRETKAAKLRRDLRDPDCRGLRLRITATGAATWGLRARGPSGRQLSIGLGAWPAMGIAASRKAAEAQRVAVRGGADPVGEKRAARAKAEVEDASTLAAIVELYGEQRASGLSSWPKAKRRIALVFAAHLHVPLTSLTIGLLQLAADRYPAQQNASLAVRNLLPILRWASAAGRAYCDRGLCDLTPSTSVRRRRRVLSREELSRILPLLRASDRVHVKALRFLLLTLTRREELGEARWRDIDLVARTWTISKTKTGEPHTVPLSDQAVALLRSLEPGHPDVRVFSTATGGRLGHWSPETQTIQHASNTSDWHRHDLRRTGATLLGDLGEQPHVIEAALNHATLNSQIAGIYNRSRYRPEVAAALQRLADLLDGIEAGGAEVVPLPVRGV